MSDWLDRLAGLDGPSVLVTVAAAEGSTPREAGAKMIVTDTDLLGTIGGGRLEFEAAARARDLLRGGEAGPVAVQPVALGPALGQCCGGAATLVFERLPARPAWLEEARALRRDGVPAVLATSLDSGAKLVFSDRGRHSALDDARLTRRALACARSLRNAAPAVPLLLDDETGRLLVEPLPVPDLCLVLFGAGHVGRALVGVLGALPWRILWVDGRAEQFPERVPDNVEIVVSDVPEAVVERAPPDSCFVVMTCSHPLDLALVEAVLRRGEFRFLGLIGSMTKRRKFERRLIQRGVAPETLRRLTCPVGLPGLGGKHPAEIAIATAAQLLRVRDATLPASTVAEAMPALP